ncbi:MAG: hypothetical protein AB2689_28700 [Candidatus Thiodiazotropha taylori]
MEFKIFNVRHGFCAALMDTNYLALIDCGHDGNNFRPLEWLYNRGYRHINSLIISNFDQDHISDLATLSNNFTVGALAVNPSVSASVLRSIKRKGGPISNEMEILLRGMENPNLDTVYHVPYQVDNAYINLYWIYYPLETETNNLSLVTFIRFGTGNIIYPGDIERNAWNRFLADPRCLYELQQTNVFIASHHGRLNGYNENVFDYCSPEVVIISDQERLFSTQEHDRYSKHASGINMGTILNPQNRKVLTTRRDGHITLKNNGEITYVRLGL